MTTPGPHTLTVTFTYDVIQGNFIAHVGGANIAFPAGRNVPLPDRLHNALGRMRQLTQDAQGKAPLTPAVAPTYDRNVQAFIDAGGLVQKVGVTPQERPSRLKPEGRLQQQVTLADLDLDGDFL